MKTKVLMISILLVLLLAFPAFAADTVTSTSISLDDAVQRSNPLPEGDDNKLDDDAELEYATFTLTVTADAGANLTISDFGISYSASDYVTFDDEVNSSDIFEVSSLPASVENATSDTFTVKVLIPSDLNAIDTNFNAVQHSVTATLTTSSGDLTAEMTFYAENGLELDDVDIVDSQDEKWTCDVDTDKESLDCEDEVDELFPEEDFTATFVVKNVMDSDSELDFEDVEVDLDDESDVEAEDNSYKIDIDADEEDSREITFEVDAEDGDDATIDIEAVVVDENGARHGFKHSFEVGFETAQYDVDLRGLVARSNSVCPGDFVTVAFDIKNIGTKDQDSLAYDITSPELGWNEIVTRINLDGDKDGDGETESVSKTLEVPSDARSGVYKPLVTVFYEDDNDDEKLIEIVTLTVESCGQTTPTTTVPTQPTTNTGNTGTNTGSGIVIDTPTNTGNQGQVTVTEPAPTTSNTVVATAKPKSSTNVGAIFGLSLLVLLLIIIAVVLIVLVARRK
jgi:hypothetical protein